MVLIVNLGIMLNLALTTLPLYSLAVLLGSDLKDDAGRHEPLTERLHRIVCRSGDQVLHSPFFILTGLMWHCCTASRTLSHPDSTHIAASIPIAEEYHSNAALCPRQEHDVPHAPVDLYGQPDGSSDRSQLSQLRSQKAKQLEKDSEASTEQFEDA